MRPMATIVVFFLGMPCSAFGEAPGATADSPLITLGVGAVMATNKAGSPGFGSLSLWLHRRFSVEIQGGYDLAQSSPFVSAGGTGHISLSQFDLLLGANAFAGPNLGYMGTLGLGAFIERLDIRFELGAANVRVLYSDTDEIHECLDECHRWEPSLAFRLSAGLSF